MDEKEKHLRLEAIEMALEDIDRIIETMQEKNYPKDQLNDFIRKRWDLWNEQYKTKKAQK